MLLKAVKSKERKLSSNDQTFVSYFFFRLFVECRYTPGSVGVSYMVKTPTLGPALHNRGVFGVQLRIAKGRVFDFENWNFFFLSCKILIFVCVKSVYIFFYIKKLIEVE